MGIVRPIVQECFIPEQYTSSPEIIKNCLKDVLNEGIINSQVSAPVETKRNYYQETHGAIYN